MLSAPAPDTQAKIVRLHEIYCTKTKSSPRLVFSQELWARLLQSYEWDAVKLAADVQLVLRYLQKQIVAEKRNPGAIKLANLLKIDQFDADLTEARIVLKPKVESPKTQVQNPLPADEAGQERLRLEAVEAMKSLKQTIRRNGPQITQITQITQINAD